MSQNAQNTPGSRPAYPAPQRPPAETTLSTGWSGIDRRLMGGIRQGELSTFGAAANTGRPVSHLRSISKATVSLERHPWPFMSTAKLDSK
jgi:hypothetical protein